MSLRRTVLVVDDQDIVVSAVKALLEPNDVIDVIGSAWNGEEALKLVEELSPDIVLMDIDMPVMDGVEATRQIVDRFPATRVLILTGLYEPDRIDLALRAGAVSVVTKSQMATQLVSSILLIAARDAVQGAT